MIGVAGLASLGLRFQATSNPNALEVVSLWSLISVGSFFLLRSLTPRADLLLLITPLALTGLGLVFIYRLDLQRLEVATALNAVAPQSLALTQMLWLLIGVLLALVIIRFFPSNALSRYPMLSGALAVVLILLPVLPLGTEINGARLWVRLGEFQFQPGEFGKLLFAIFLGAYLSRFELYRSFDYREFLGLKMPTFRELGPALVTVLLCATILIFQRDLGTALLIMLLFAAVASVATGRLVITGVTIAVLAFGGLIAVNLFVHVERRIEAWLDPFGSPTDSGYQILQSIFGLASGGIFGEGLGSGSPNLIPFAATDFIIATIGEEIGYAGLLAILALFALLVGRALRLGVALKNPSSQLIVVSVTALLAIQTLLVIGGIVRIVPLTGLTTPFLSYGGSSLIACWLAVGLFLKLSNESNSPDLRRVDLASDETLVIRR